MTKKKKANLKELKIRLSLEFEGQHGMDNFARLLRLLYNNGFENEVRAAAGEIIKKARENGAAVPAELEAFANGRTAAHH
jgi:hypothetical protein